MARKKTGGSVNAALEKALAGEIEEISKKDDAGKYVYSVIDRTRVYGQAIKLEAIKAKLDDPGYGEGFK